MPVDNCSARCLQLCVFWTESRQMILQKWNKPGDHTSALQIHANNLKAAGSCWMCACCRSGHKNFVKFWTLPPRRQENLLQESVSSLDPTFLTSLYPSLRDVMRGIVKATQNCRRAKKKKHRQVWAERGHWKPHIQLPVQGWVTFSTRSGWWGLYSAWFWKLPKG